MDSEDQDQTAQYVQSDLDLTLSTDASSVFNSDKLFTKNEGFS